MAPPERYPLAEFGDKKSYSKFLNLVTSHMAEDEKVNCIMASIPKEWKNTFLRKIIQTDEDAKLTSDGLLKLVEEECKCQVESEPVAVRVNKLFTTRFPFKEKNACSKIIEELENCLSDLVPESSKDVFLSMFFIQLIPPRMKKEFKDCKLPSKEDIIKFAREQDLLFQHSAVFGKDNDKRKNFDDKSNKSTSEKLTLKSVETKNHRKTSDTKNECNVANTKPTKNVEIKFQNLYYDEALNDIACTQAFIGDSLIPFTIGLDSCAAISSLSLSDFNKLPDIIKNSIICDDQVYKLKSVHNTSSETLGFINTTVSLPDYGLSDAKVQLFIDPQASISLLSFSFLKNYNINPLSKSEIKVKSEEHEFMGITFGQECLKTKEFLQEVDSKILTDKDFEPGNKISVSLSVEDSFQFKRYPCIPVSKECKVQLETSLNDQVSKNWLRKINSNEIVEGWNQCVVVEYPDKLPRICFSCINLNKHIDLPEMPDLPNIKKILFESNTDVYSCWDINSAFSRISLDPDCRKFCNILTPIGLYQSNVLVFGLKSAPAIYYSSMMKILEGLEKYLIVYLDDILNIAPSNIHEDINIQLLSRLRKFNFKLSLNKCCVSVSKLKFIGFEIEVGRGIHIDKMRMDALLEIKTPDTGKELKSILAKFQFCSDFIPNYSVMLDDLHDYVNCKSSIRELIHDKFQSLLKCVAKAICLFPIPKDIMNLEIFVDCSKKAISNIMFCVSKSKKYPIHVGGRLLKKHERNYNDGIKCLLSAQETLKQNQYLCSAFQTKIFSKIKHIHNLTDLAPAVIKNTFQRIILKVLPFDVSFHHIDTSKNLVSLMANSDFQEKKSQALMCNVSINAPLSYLGLDQSLVKESYSTDKDASLLHKIFTKQDDQHLVKCLDPILRKHISLLHIDNELIYLDGRLYIPKNLIPNIVTKLHSKHASTDSMVKLAKKFYIFNSLYSRLKNVYDSCELCILNRRNRNQIVNSWPDTTQSHERFHSDIGEFHKKKFLVVIDVFSQFIILRKLKSLHSQELIGRLEEIFADFGKPKIFVSDNATVFASQVTVEALKNWGIYQSFSVPMASTSNGSAEKAVGLVKDYLKKFLSTSKNFDSALKSSQLALNERIIRDNKSPFELFFSITTTIDDIISAYEFESIPLDLDCTFKKDKNTYTWFHGKVTEQIHNNIFKIFHDDRYYVRKSDYINFLSKGKVVPFKDALKDMKPENNMNQSPPKMHVEELSDFTLNDNFSNTMDSPYLYKLLYSDKDQIDNLENSITQLPNLDATQDDNLFQNLSPADLSIDKVNMNPVDLPPLTPLDSSNSVSSLSNVNNVPSYVKLDSQLSVEQYIKENDISIICSTDGSCESGRGLAYYIKYPKGEIEKSFRAGNNSSAQYLEITALHQCLVELSELNNKNEFPSSSKILIITDSDYGARALSTDLKKWLSCGFQKTDGKKLTHENIIKSSWKLIVNLDSTIIIGKVPGHKGIILNEKVDTMARRAAVRPVKQAVSFNF